MASTTTWVYGRNSQGKKAVHKPTCTYSRESGKCNCYNISSFKRKRKIDPR